MLHRMVFGFPDGELMLSIPMPAPRGEAKRACHFVWFRPVAESALAALCTDESGRRHGVSIPPPLIRPELIAALKRDADALLAPQLAALVKATAQIILQPIFDLELPRIAFGRVALVGRRGLRRPAACGDRRDEGGHRCRKPRRGACRKRWRRGGRRSSATTTNASPMARRWWRAAATSARILPRVTAIRDAHRDADARIWRGGLVRDQPIAARVATSLIQFQASLIVLAARFAPEDSADALRKSPRARGTPGVQRTHGLRHLATPKRNGDLGRGRRPVLVEPQVRLLSSVPRAVFEALLRTAPGG